MSRELHATDQEMFRSVVDSIQDGLWATDGQGQTVFLNARMASMLGRSVAEMLGRTMRDFIHPAFRHREVVVLDPAISTGVARQDIPFQRKDGSALWTSVTSGPLVSAGGERIGLLNAVCDISTRKETEKRLQQMSDLFRQFGDAVGDVAWITDWPEHVVDYVSPAYEKIWGLTREALYRNPLDWIAAIHPDDRDRVAAAFAKIAEQGYDEVFRLIQPDGRTRWIRDRGFPVRDAVGRVYRVAGLAEDVTERRQAVALRRAQNRVLEQLATGEDLRTVLNSLVMMTEEQADGMLCSVLQVSDDGTRLEQGVAPSLPESYNDAIDGTRIGPAVGSCGTAAHHGRRIIVEDIETDPLWKDFRALALESGLRASWSQPIFSSKGKVLGTFAMYYRQPRVPGAAAVKLIEDAAHLAGIAIERTTTERKRRENEQTLRQVLDLVPHMIFAKDGEGRILLANQALAEAYGTSVESLVGQTHRALHDDNAQVSRMLDDDREVMRSARQKFIPEEEFTDCRGNVRLLQTTKIPFRQSVSHEPAILGIAIDITERRQLEQQLSFYADSLDLLFLDRSARADGSGQWLRSLYDSALDFYVTTNADGEILDANRAACRVLGIDPAHSPLQHVADLLTVDSRPALEKALQTLRRDGESDAVALKLRHTDGSAVDSDVRGRTQLGPSGDIEELRLIFYDVSRRRSIERRLAQTEQLILTGRLASRTAHEINNPLQALLVHLSLVADALPATFAERGSWERIEEGVNRISQVVNVLLNLHRVGRGRREEVDVNALIREALHLCEKQFSSQSVETEVHLAENLPRVRGLSQQLYQVFLNLLLNGAEAMERGKLVVTTRSTSGRVVIEVKDSGPGIHPDDLPSIFKEFFSSRKGHGTGLGLLVTYNRIKEHGGEIEVESTPGEGSLFRIYLPASSSES